MQTMDAALDAAVSLLHGAVRDRVGRLAGKDRKFFGTVRAEILFREGMPATIRVSDEETVDGQILRKLAASSVDDRT